MGKKRVYEFAKEMHVDNKDVLDIAKNLGIEVKTICPRSIRIRKLRSKGCWASLPQLRHLQHQQRQNQPNQRRQLQKIMLRASPKSRSSMKTSLLSLTKLLMEKSF
ncbi:translation initiation factor IF-2 N-terminal domain-containing protein [Lacticaseibacillus rhamnosus]|uniref:translation initiation factor IF-2 N-terminal domain-containing protein n=1 Tax=Lacticaseibacillus rhamnosus TaxID=47715 RepID=UPI001CDAF454